MKRWIRRFVWLLILLGVVGGGWLAWRPRPLPVEVGATARGLLRVTVNASGRTRAVARHVLTAPASGQLSRIELRPGDEVRAGQMLAALSGAARDPLGPREQAEVGARAAAAGAGEAETRATVERARLALESARRELARTEKLVRTGALPQQAADSARLEEQLRQRELEAAEAAVRRARNEVQAALATQGKVSAKNAGESLSITAPASGRVLRVLFESEGPVMAGTPLMEIGDLSELEVVADVPTTEAVRVSPGAAVMIEGWGGNDGLRGRVRRVEMAAFTKISALGVEEQRVNVIIDREGDQAEWSALGDGYRVETRIVVWERTDALKVPLAALTRDGTQWRSFVVANGRAVSRAVEIGQRNGRDAEVVAGLSEGERVVLYPGDKVADGVKVAATRKD